MASHNRNPGGKNQHGDVRKCYIPLWGEQFGADLTSCAAKADDEEFANIMKIYHREKISSNKKISERLFSDHGIKMRYDPVCLGIAKTH